MTPDATALETTARGIKTTPPSVSSGPNCESLVAESHAVQSLARNGRDSRIDVLAEAVALGRGRPWIAHEVERLQRPEGAQEFPHLCVMQISAIRVARG